VEEGRYEKRILGTSASSGGKALDAAKEARIWLVQETASQEWETDNCGRLWRKLALSAIVGKGALGVVKREGPEGKGQKLSKHGRPGGKPQRSNTIVALRKKKQKKKPGAQKEIITSPYFAQKPNNSHVSEAKKTGEVSIRITPHRVLSV